MCNLPGSTTRSASKLEGEWCEEHPDRPATIRVQGETDSFGAEYIFFCEECYQAFIKEAEEPQEHQCEWCKATTTDCTPFRDWTEGSCGPVYMVCLKCRHRAIDNMHEELEC